MRDQDPLNPASLADISSVIVEGEDVYVCEEVDHTVVLVVKGDSYIFSKDEKPNSEFYRRGTVQREGGRITLAGMGQPERDWEVTPEGLKGSLVRRRHDGRTDGWTPPGTTCEVFLVRTDGTVWTD